MRREGWNGMDRRKGETIGGIGLLYTLRYKKSEKIKESREKIVEIR